MKDITLMTAHEVAGLFRNRQLSPAELIEEILKKNDRLKETLNAYVTVFPDRARAAAAQAQERLDKGGAGPLCGIPVALKDLFYTKGVLTAAGSAIFADFVPEYDGTVTKRLCEAGTVLLGKTNTHELALGPTGDVSHFGPMHNPWDPGRITGGSSGGSTAAVGAGLGCIAMGTDTGGSIRTPSGLCGTVGFKPTYGMVSLYGVLPLSFTLDHAGPITRSVLDAAMAMDALTGYDPLDTCPNPYRGGPTNYYETVRGTKRLDGVIIGVPGVDFFAHVDIPVESRFRDGLRALERLGATIRDVSLPDPKLLFEVSTLIMHSEGAWVYRDRLAANPEGFLPELRARFERGLSHTAVEYIEAQKNRALITAQWNELMKSVNVVAMPTVPVEASPLGARTVVSKGKEESVASIVPRHMRYANVTGSPALSVPCGLTPRRLPAGLMLVGRPNGDEEVLKIGYAFEREMPFEFPVL